MTSDSDLLLPVLRSTSVRTTGVCLEYLFKNDLLAHLERLCEVDRPHGVKGGLQCLAQADTDIFPSAAEVLRTFNNLIVLLSERFLMHNAVHRPLRRLLSSCAGDQSEEKVDGEARVVGAAGMDIPKDRRTGNEALEGDLVDLMCNLCSKMRA